MPVRSAGLILYRTRNGLLEVFLIHPGGPFWRNKDDGAWSIPKGLIAIGEDPLVAARREFTEETGFEVSGEPSILGTFRQPSGKQITAFALEGDCDPTKLVSNTFSLEWPSKSGVTKEFPEADRGSWFGEHDADGKILKGQRPILGKLRETRPR